MEEIKLRQQQIINFKIKIFTKTKLTNTEINVEKNERKRRQKI